MNVNELLQNHSEEIAKIGHHIAGQFKLHPDEMQSDAMIEAWKSFLAFDPTRGTNLVKWVMTRTWQRTRHRAIDKYRQATRFPTVSIDTTDVNEIKDWKEEGDDNEDLTTIINLVIDLDEQWKRKKQRQNRSWVRRKAISTLRDMGWEPGRIREGIEEVRHSLNSI